MPAKVIVVTQREYELMAGLLAAGRVVMKQREDYDKAMDEEIESVLKKIAQAQDW